MKRELSFQYVLAVIVARAGHRFCRFLKAASRLRLLNVLLASMKIAASVVLSFQVVFIAWMAASIPAIYPAQS